MAEEVIKLKTLSEIDHSAMQKRWILKDKALKIKFISSSFCSTACAFVPST